MNEIIHDPSFIIYTDFIKWRKLIEGIGGTLVIEPMWRDTMLAYDFDNRQIGSFVFSQYVWAGIVFKSAAHLKAFIA